MSEVGDLIALTKEQGVWAVVAIVEAGAISALSIFVVWLIKRLLEEARLGRDADGDNRAIAEQLKGSFERLEAVITERMPTAADAAKLDVKLQHLLDAKRGRP